MADLKTIIEISQDELKRQVPVEHAVVTALDQLGGREADVLRRRFGLRDSECQTLAEIGTEFGITRERVRQVESQGLKKFRAGLSKGPLHDILIVTGGYIRRHGNIVAQTVLYDRFLPESQRTDRGKRALSFLLEQSGDLVTVKPKVRLRAFYAGSPAHQRAVAQIEPTLNEILQELNEPAETPVVYQRLKAHPDSHGVGYLVDQPFTEAVLEISKNFVQTTDGAWGLASWPSINPRNIRQKTLYALKLAGTPLHFTDITAQIERAKLDTKRVTTQAVHNELINGVEFILIGRGIYALAEWGYVSGTVADVIQSIIGEHGPLEREQIVSYVLKQRHVSRNTILINLQEKLLFERLLDGRYGLRGKASAALGIVAAPVPVESPAASKGSA